MKDEKCPCCGRRPEFEIAAIWYTLEEKEPPNDRPFLAKIKSDKMFPYRLIFINTNDYMIEISGFDYRIEDCEKWCELPKDDE